MSTATTEELVASNVAWENKAARVDAADKATGRAKYTADLYPANMLWARLIRCPAGKATIKSSDLSAARAVKGIVEVELNPNNPKGDYHGQAVGHIVGESKQACDDAIAALKIEWEKLPAATQLRAEAKGAKGAAAAPPPRRGNRSPSVNPAEVEAEIAAAGKQSVTAEYETQVQPHCCLEPHGTIVDFRGDHAVAWGSSQATFGFRDQLAHELGLPPEKIEFHCEFVGGGFGSKFQIGEEGKLAAQMSKKFNRPVRATLNRKEEQLDGGMRPSSLQSYSAAYDGEGKITATRVHLAGGVGYAGGGGGASTAARYEFGKVGRTEETVHLASQSPRPARAPGHPQGMFGVEMFMDELALAVGMDPLAFRQKNDSNPMRQEMYKAGAQLIGWERRKPDGAWPGVMKTGFGMGATDWGNGGGRATVDVVIHRSGQIEAFSGSQDIGTGFKTLLADIVAHQIGVPRGRVEAHCGVSTYPDGPASGGSRVSTVVAPKAMAAAESAKRQLLQTVAAEWKVDPGTIQIHDGVVSSGGNSVVWEKACRLMTQESIKASESEGGLFDGKMTNSEGVQFAEVVVDTETGIVRVKKIVALQCMGQAINHATCENQITGGVIQGMSYALFEERVLSKANGACLNANMEMYKIAGSMDIPEIVPILWPVEPGTAVNSLGEPATVPTAGMIGCAVANAIGVRVRTLPLTPDRILAALAAKGGTQA